MTGIEPPEVTRQIASFIAATRFEDLPDDAIQVAVRCVLDGMAVMIAGTQEACATIARDYVRSVGGKEEVTVFGAGGRRSPIHLAAFANGIAGHALDYDDTALSLEKDRSVLIHPTMPALCAALAVSELTGASGPEFLTAFVLGFETEVKVAEAIHPDHFAGGRGFHSSGTIGVFGSAAAAAKLMKLTEEQTCHALAIAATMSAGLGVNHGTMSKPLNMGRSAETGVTAARLASLGFDGPGNALEGGRGFFEAFGGGFAAEKIVDRLGAPFAILDPGSSIKPYPSGVVGHPGMDAMKTLVTLHDIAPGDVAKVVVRTGLNVIAPGPLRVAHARTALEGKFCVPFQMAAMILRRKAGLAEFSDDFVASEACQAMQKRVTAVIAPDIAALGKDKIVFEIELHTHSGAVHVQRSEEHYRGGPRNPLTWEELVEKFRDCSEGVIEKGAQDTFIANCRNIADLPTILPLVKSLI
ncbi:MmgE/PrpD family protein [Actibacterium pelagium]|uniref:2-methylcitrate dehydratase PrpD n=1 Tax=Actibacterium pelagium TaxID=2029103 RepID=A0A917EJQ2_9RHOB|nr:MmgE/PrpD family protein [Actibacterium pelagium]GGE45518.1 hypothetical protein GCM10011517_11410 [Actibacterium pelagium]